jgi:phage-related protein
MSDTTVKPVLWIRSSYKDFRAVYTVKFATAIYVLHAFQKKSKSGIKTSTEDLKLIQRRLKAAEADYKVQLGKGNAS